LYEGKLLLAISKDNKGQYTAFDVTIPGVPNAIPLKPRLAKQAAGIVFVTTHVVPGEYLQIWEHNLMSGYHIYENATRKLTWLERDRKHSIMAMSDTQCPKCDWPRMTVFVGGSKASGWLHCVYNCNNIHCGYRTTTEISLGYALNGVILTGNSTIEFS